MEYQADVGRTFRNALLKALDGAEVGRLQIVARDGHHEAVHGQVFVGPDFIQFANADQRLVIVPFDRIARIVA